MLLSQILINALNANSANIGLISRASNLCERWEIVRTHCGEWEEQSDCVWLENLQEWILIDDAFCCNYCQEFSLNGDQRSVYTRRGDRLQLQDWCEYCHEENSFCCDNCGEQFNHEKLHSVGDDSLCMDCYGSREEEGECDVHPLLKSYHSDRPRNPYGYNQAVYSAELEMEGAEGRIWELVENLHKSEVYRLTTERDGSLSEKLGVEVQISYRDSISSLADSLCEVAEIAKKAGARAWDAKSAPNVGLHISSNSHSVWTLHRKMRLAYLVQKLRVQLVQIAGRDCQRYSAFPASEQGSLRRAARGGYGKFTALNFSGDRMEWRLFRGTLNPDRLRLYCDAVSSLEFWACSDLPSKHLLKVASGAIAELWSGFAAKKGGN